MSHYWENSFIVCLIVRFWNAVCDKFSESLAGGLLARLVHAFRSGAIWRFLTGDFLTGE